MRLSTGLTIVGLASMVAVPAAAQQPEWAKMPRMQLERQFAGPLRDTLIQRWRDPVDGLVCFVYLPITAQHTPPTPSGYVQYGPNAIGSISCVGTPGPAAPAPAAKAGDGKGDRRAAARPAPAPAR